MPTWFHVGSKTSLIHPGLSGRITVSLSRAGTSRWGVGFTGADYPQLGPRITLDV